ncbi:MAG TPA: ATP-dependent DNA helicase RecG [Steroidobacteraceae bacterium]|nr:ATP-dependent DNA helicase RecG [Steroidobacteraceae bacterium]
MIDAKPVTALRGVGERQAQRLRALGVETAQDLLFLLPVRYEDRTRVVPLGEVNPGQRAVIEGEVLLTEVAFRGRRQMLSRIGDGSGYLTLRFFHFTAQQPSSLPRGARVRCFGEVRRGPHGLEMVHPEYRRVDRAAAAASGAAAGRPGEIETEEHLTPIYPGTEGLTQARLRQLVRAALDDITPADLTDWLPPPLLADTRLPALRKALEYVHRPPTDAPVDLLADRRHPAQRRLAFEELLAHQLSLKLLRRRVQQDPGWPLEGAGALKARLLGALPFRPTGAQQRVLEEIEADLKLARPMLRLVQGDVGCGKTLVAALAATRAIEAGRQVALMAPTELLADQHAQNFRRWFEPLGIDVALLSGRQTGKARATARARIRAGLAQLVIGTHALFQQGVEFASLALAIVDEQHRFGVHQRLSLREKGARDGHQPHQLIMTATPIPRTLAMTAYADLDVSVIDELPPGRTAVTTAALADARRDEVVERIRAACLSGRQAYWVCPLIDESDEMPFRAAEETAAALAAALPELVVGVVHGRMPPAAKDLAMRRFKDAQIQLLVATTVIEVGVDVPNATLMVIENAERMGLAQLHQLRGRVGRGRHASSCLLLYRAPLSLLARERLAVMRHTNDGFEVARRDLELRGPGELLGTRQTGLAQMRVADLARDADLLPRVQIAAQTLLRDWPTHVTPLVRRWVGHGEQYGRVG